MNIIKHNKKPGKELQKEKAIKNRWCKYIKEQYQNKTKKPQNKKKKITPQPQTDYMYEVLITTRARHSGK